MADIDKVIEELADARAEIITLSFAILRHGGHTEECGVYLSNGDTECDCGWRDLERKCHGMDGVLTSPESKHE